MDSGCFSSGHWTFDNCPVFNLFAWVFRKSGLLKPPFIGENWPRFLALWEGWIIDELVDVSFCWAASLLFLRNSKFFIFWFSPLFRSSCGYVLTSSGAFIRRIKGNVSLLLFFLKPIPGFREDKSIDYLLFFGPLSSGLSKDGNLLANFFVAEFWGTIMLWNAVLYCENCETSGCFLSLSDYSWKVGVTCLAILARLPNPILRFDEEEFTSIMDLLARALGNILSDVSGALSVIFWGR